MSQVSVHKIFEGTKTNLIRADGSEDEISTKEYVHSVGIDLKEMDNRNIKDEYNDLLSIFMDSLKKHQIQMFESINSTAKKYGNEINCHNQKLNPEIHLLILIVYPFRFDDGLINWLDDYFCKHKSIL